MATAARLGIPPEIIQDARGMLTGSSQELETLLANLMTEKQKVAALQKDLTAERDEFNRRNAELDSELQRLKTEERKAIQDARDAVVREAAELHKEIRQAAAELRKTKTASSIEKAKRSLSEVREQLEKDVWQTKTNDLPEADAGIIKPGDTVRLKEAGMTAAVLSISEQTGEIEVQAGRTKMRLGLDSVVKVTQLKEITTLKVQPVGRRVPRELDLRGKRADEVEPALDSYLNDAARSDMPEVRIIHGIATGTVRNIVREFLSGHPLVKSFRSGERDEGGDGATVVRF
jgi:DNA mismatch repair protein MutS2